MYSHHQNKERIPLYRFGVHCVCVTVSFSSRERRSLVVQSVCSTKKRVDLFLNSARRFVYTPDFEELSESTDTRTGVGVIRDRMQAVLMCTSGKHGFVQFNFNSAKTQYSIS